MRNSAAYLLTVLASPTLCFAAYSASTNLTKPSSTYSLNVSAVGVLNNDDIANQMATSTTGYLQSPARPTSYKPSIQMGLMGRGDYTPIWWQPTNQSYKSSTWWEASAPWWLIAPLTDNQATNTRIEVGNVLFYAHSKTTGTWNLLVSGTPQWANVYSYVNGTKKTRSVNKVINSSTGNPMYLGTTDVEYIHGGMNKVAVRPADFDGVVNCVTARLAVDPVSGVDDTRLASYGMQMGMDWYPTLDFVISRDIPEVDYLPAAQYSKFKRLTKNWQSFCSAPLNPPGREGDQNYTMPSTGVAMSLSKLSDLAIPAAPFDNSVVANSNGEVTLPYGSKLSLNWSTPDSKNCSLYDGTTLVSTITGGTGSLTTAPILSSKRLNLICKNATRQTINVTVTQ